MPAKIYVLYTTGELIFAGIKFRESLKFWWISWKLVPAKIFKKLSIREILFPWRFNDFES